MEMHYVLPILLLMSPHGLRLPSHRGTPILLVPQGIDVWANAKPVNDVLKSISSSMGHMRLARTDFQLRGNVTAKLINVPPSYAVDRVVGPLGGKVVHNEASNYLVIDDGYRSMTDSILPDRKMFMDVADADVRQVLRIFFKEVDKSYTVDGKIEGKVTLAVKNVDANEVLAAILEQVDGTVRYEGGIANILHAYPAWTPYRHWSSNLQAPVRYFLAGAQTRQEALSKFARATNTAYVLSSDTELSESISLLVQDETVESALKQILGPKYVFAVHDWRIHVMKR